MADEHELPDMAIVNPEEDDIHDDYMEFTPEPEPELDPTAQHEQASLDADTPMQSRPSTRQIASDDHSDSFEHIAPQTGHASQPSVQLRESSESPSMADSTANRRHSQSISSAQFRALIKQSQTEIQELKHELGQCRQENEKLVTEKETLQIEMDTRIDELNVEMENMQIESQQYQLRYQEIHEELNELRSSQMEMVSSGKENQELLLQLHNKEQAEMSLIIELEQANKMNESLKKQVKSQTQNIAKLQQGIIALKKEKSALDKNYQDAVDKYEILRQQSTLDINHLSETVAQLQHQNELMHHQLSHAEQEKMEMQNNFTEATMDLITNELNEAHDDGKKEETHVRLERISTSDMKRTYHDHHEDDPATPQFGAATATFNNRFISQGSLGNVDKTLLDTLAEEDYGGHHSRKSSVDSRYGGYDVDPVKLKQDIRDILVSDIKTLIAQEITNMSHSTLPGAGALSRAATGTDRLEELPDKMEELLQLAKNKGLALQARESHKEPKDLRLNQEIMNQMMDEFKESMTDVLKKDVVQNIAASKHDHQQFQEKINETMTNLMESFNNHDKLEQMMKEAIQSQMTVLQIALENQIGNTVSGTVEDAINRKVNETLRENIKQDMNNEINEIRELLMSQNKNDEQEEMQEKEVKLDEAQLEEILNRKLEECMENIMSGKIDGFMDAFRKEVVPEVQAVFEQLSLSKGAGYMEVDDEKANSNHSELLIMNNKLKEEVEALKKEKEEHDRVLKDVATSKVHQVVKLQNLLDHARDDNRVLQYQLARYKEKFVEIRDAQDDTVVNRLWGYWNNKPSNHLST